MEVKSRHWDEQASGGVINPGLWDAILDLGPGDLLVVRDVSRWGRDEDVFALTQWEIKQRGARIVSLAGEGLGLEDDDEPGSASKLVRFIAQWWAERQRAMIRRATRRSMRRMQARGKRVTHPSKTPYGWMTDPEDRDRLIEEPVEQMTLARMIELRDENRSLRSIARILDEEGRTTREGGPWRHHVIKAILARADEWQSWNAE